ncbi:MAG: LamG domain-containing protein [Nanoarchaeota archaeon]|nr:LamG domain-containing protein [Nanoarchaeota archaeon]
MNKTYILLLTALLILPLAYSSSVVMNLTFDDQADPWKDYSSLNHQFTSTAAFADASKCKFNSCADFTAMSNDILTSLAKFTLASGFSSCFWVYPTDPNFENTHFYYAIGKDPGTLKQAAENQYGTAAHFDTSTGNVLDGPSDSSTSTPNSWNHYCLSYDKAAGVKVWRNGVLIREKAYTGTLNSTASEAIVIGAGMFGGAYTMRGYMDEFVAFDYAIDQNKVSSLYGSQKVGSVSSVDVYVKAIKYEIPYDYANKNKLVSGGRMPILITIANAGSENTGSFNYKVELGNTAVCSSTISLSGLSETTITCDWQTSVGFHQGFVRIDAVASDANKDNNVQRLYIPFMDRPWFHFSAGDIATLKQYCGNSQNKIPNSACTFAETFQSEDFSSAWTGIDVDPRAKKGRENAMGCMLNGYNGNEQCKRAMNHLNGWASRPLSTYDSVQSIHELGEVGITYDLMFPYLTKSDNERLTAQFEAICQHITNLKNTRPDLDPDIIRGDNGFGFGSGMATFCYAIIGADKNNPTLIQKEDQSYWGKNIPDSWMNREQSYLKAYKDDAFAQYQEGWLYKTYSQPHIVENLYFEKRFGLNDLGKYQNAMCAMGREAVTMLLDTNYNGASLRNDEPRKFRAIQRGDSNSYQHITDGNFIDWDILLYYGALCEDKDVKANSESIKSEDGKKIEMEKDKSTTTKSQDDKQLEAIPERPKTIEQKYQDALFVEENIQKR